ncbi:MAG: hypothetical protein Tsb0019_18170 [Roseibium sp.]
MISAMPVAANAITVDFVALTTTTLGEQTAEVDPLGGLTPSSSSGFNALLTASVSGQYRSPWQGSSNDGANYASVQAGGFVEFVFTQLQDSVSLIWGSPDTYNDLVITLIGDTTETVNGSQVFGTSGILASLVTITDVSFNKLRFESGRNAFEFANLKTTAVPLPAALPLLAGGLGILGFAGWRRKKAA